ncbi:sufE-like protein 1, chloroplastic/mitochondrial, partial [Ananas comosus]|uniref:SufE-like protein 1, chloroplastic/mitochondrial n=2 Tax=Ananas comosus TaxID=4615 RepID=A0A6P5G596_ANACO
TLPNPTPPPPPSFSSSSSSSSSSLDPSLLPPKLRDIVALFQSVPDSKAKYQQLLHYASKLPPLDPAHKSDSNRVSGCVSRVWVRAFKDGCGGGGDNGGGCGGICFEADSDSVLTKGLAALLVLGLSGSPARDIARVPPEFVELLGIRQSLTPSRNSGFLNMLRLMQRKALELEALEGGGNSGEFGVSEDKRAISEGKDSILEEKPREIREITANGHANFEKGERLYGLEGEEEDDGKVGVEVNSTSSGSVTGGRKERIRGRLEKELSPVELEIEDISHLHAGHAGVAGSSGGETHFNVRVVSKAFEGKSMLKRHRLVYDLLKDELSSGLHALSIDAKTPSEV